MVDTHVEIAEKIERWPALPLAEWQETYATLHRWMQLVGKTRLSLAPMRNHWWQATLYLTSHGLGTSVMPADERLLDIEFDFVDHRLIFRTSDGQRRSMELAPRSVADFYDEYVAMLRALEVAARIWPVPVELMDAMPFPEDRVHASYDPEAAQRWWRALTGANRVLEEFRGRFLGKSSPAHFWWGSFDLACTRFSGRVAPRHPGGIPNCPDYVAIEAYSRECSSVGWWPGSVGVLEEPAFYAYAYPQPPGYDAASVEPRDAYYHPTLREWILPYEAVRAAANPEAAVLAFCESTYVAAADLGRWDRASLERRQEDHR
jgi:hypothetical protein